MGTQDQFAEQAKGRHMKEEEEEEEEERESFFLLVSPLYILIVGVEDYCFIQPHLMTHTHTRIRTLGRSALDDGSVHRRPLPDNT